jgi:7-carboxy-7-deazaguanine synthase
MAYQVKSIFGPTLQGEGLHAGMPCLFVRLAGCNAWDGRLETRGASACPYCDTDFRGGERLELSQIAQRLESLRAGTSELGCVLTGGEPLLQADSALIAQLAGAFRWVDIETNGTRPAPAHADNVFVSCSPKLLAREPVLVEMDWWKILIPDQERFLARALASGKPVFLQPTMPDAGAQDESYQDHLRRCLELCFRHGCRLSIQLHKVIGVE